MSLTNVPHSPIDKYFYHKICTQIEILKLNDITNQWVLTDIYRTCHSNTTEYIFFSRIHENFSKINHISEHKENVWRYRKSEFTSYMIPDHS